MALGLAARCGIGKVKHMYRAFGLNIESDLPLSELAAARGDAADVKVRLHDHAAPTQRGDGAFWFAPASEPFVFRVTDGRTIDVWAPRDTRREDLSIWLLGTVMAALLHQRGQLTVHANCLESPFGRVVALAGNSGAGKSSLAAMASAAGWGVLGDDLLAIDAHARVDPGVLRLKLWREDVALLGLAPSALSKVASDLDKYHVPLPPIADGARSLSRLYVLGKGQLAFERLEGAAAAQALLTNLYRFEVGQEVRGETAEQFTEALALAGKVEIWRFDRPDDRSGLADHFAKLAAHIDG